MRQLRFPGTRRLGHILFQHLLQRIRSPCLSPEMGTSWTVVCRAGLHSLDGMHSHLSVSFWKCPSANKQLSYSSSFDEAIVFCDVAIIHRLMRPRTLTACSVSITLMVSTRLAVSRHFSDYFQTYSLSFPHLFFFLITVELPILSWFLI